MSRIRPLFPADTRTRAARLALLASRLARQERYGEALTRFDQAILLDPLCAAFHDGRGALLALLNREQEALASFASAIPLARGNRSKRCSISTAACSTVAGGSTTRRSSI